VGVTAAPEPTLALDDPVLQEFAAEVGDAGPIAVAGGRTRWAVGGPLAADVRVVTAPTGIPQYRPEEMTVRVRTGTTVEELHRTLAEAGQRTALPERGGTVGGALAVGESDLRALGRGLVRTSVLQVRYVSAEGRIVNSGGPTVKNVSGFDLPRLMVGSLGTLGLLAEVIIRTNPIPAVSRWVEVSGCSPQAVLDALLAPSTVLWDGSRLAVEVEGHGPDVDAQIAALDALGSVGDIDGPPPLPDHRWSLTPIEARDLGSGAAHDTGDFVAALGLGLVFADRPQPPRGLAPGAAAVAERLKHNFDPTGRLNPGRVPGSS